MATENEKNQTELLDQIKRLLMLGLVQQGVEGKRIAEVLGVDPATVSRALASKKIKK